ncbi:MAG TPA: hypothetical protein PKK18_08810 [Chitinophagales bacterium]|nr:hypothetical protein [Chitinophagales bacterium]HMW13559.1 hypothetical protein [Chitinophagales bacterium]HMX60613.1 hypothetical protein [Chitinophagales bacterium]HMY23634.1 hypothetical protein [Chitinophagales bacterium]HMZ34160.1 hypothetical protein [Chitinophagales bacterium]
MKKIIYTTLGVASVANEKFKELLEDLIQNNQFTEDEGKRIVDGFFFDLRQQLDLVQGNVQSKLDDIMKKFGVSDFYSLKQEFENYVQDVKSNPTLLLKLPSKK